MPQIKSAEKRVKITEKKTAENRAVKSRVATYEKKFLTALAQNDKNCEEAYKTLVSLLDKAVAENVIHANAANRKKAHYAKLLDDRKKTK